MVAGDWLRLFMIVIGLFILGLTIISLAKKHMTESFCIFWGIASLLSITSGVILRPTVLSSYISWDSMMIIFVSVICLLIAAMFFSVRISKLIRQVTELSIQVSLLNQENETLLKKLARQNEEYEENNFIYN